MGLLMEVVLHEKPQNPIIIQGFPGFGLVGAIATEFLTEHLNAKYIGHIWLEKLAPTIAIHKGHRVNPISIYYAEEQNIVLVHGITAAKGSEWDIAKAVRQVIAELNASQLICLEGVGSQNIEKQKVLYFSSDTHFSEKLKKIGYESMQEGVVLGLSAASLVRTKSVPISCLFVETHTELPDSKGGAKLIEALSKYLDIKIDYQPLMKQAEQFEQKLRKMLSQAAEAETEQKKHQESYIG